MNGKILVINSGSTSLKYKLFDSDSLDETRGGVIEEIGSGGPTNHKKAFSQMIKEVSDVSDIKAVGHRVVHGGADFTQPTEVTSKVLSKLHEYDNLAPLHNPPNLAGITASNELLQDVPDVAVFDTAFHRTMPKKAYLYGLPWKHYEEYGVRKYGFHGISHKYLMQKASEELGKQPAEVNLITCHLGGGASICAIGKGKSIDTTMGFTPGEGLLMMTRTGDMDPNVPLYLIKKTGMSVSEMDEFLDKECGVKALSEIDGGMLEVINASEKGDTKAKMALEIFIYRIRKYIGAYVAALGKVDAVVFSGAIGFRNKEVRNLVTKNMSMLENVKILPIKTNEELMIAREVKQFLEGKESVV